MEKYISWNILVVGLFVLSQPSVADVGFQGLGYLYEGNSWSSANAISGDGTVVLGQSFGVGEPSDANFLWTEAQRIGK